MRLSDKSISSVMMLNNDNFFEVEVDEDEDEQ